MCPKFPINSSDSLKFLLSHPNRPNDTFILPNRNQTNNWFPESHCWLENSPDIYIINACNYKIICVHQHFTGKCALFGVSQIYGSMIMTAFVFNLLQAINLELPRVIIVCYTPTHPITHPITHIQRWSNRTRVLVLKHFLSTRTRTRVRRKVIVLVLEYITKVIVLTITSHDYIFFI